DQRLLDDPSHRLNRSSAEPLGVGHQPQPFAAFRLEYLLAAGQIAEERLRVLLSLQPLRQVPEGDVLRTERLLWREDSVAPRYVPPPAPTTAGPAPRRIGSWLTSSRRSSESSSISSSAGAETCLAAAAGGVATAGTAVVARSSIAYSSVGERAPGVTAARTS